MPSHSIAKRRGIKHAPELPRSVSTPARTSYQTPPASRSSEPVYLRDAGDLDAFSSRALGDPLDETFEGLRLQAECHARHPRTRYESRDDYGVCYASYQENDLFSPPTTPQDDRSSLDWDSTFDPFTSSSFRRGSLVMDPAAFDSTPSVNHTPSPPATSPAVRLKRRADALREFGRKVLPRLGIRTKAQEITDWSLEDRVQGSKAPLATGSTSSNSRSSAGRTRSNTLESNFSARSYRSRTSSANPPLPSFPLQDGEGRPSRELLQDSSDVLSPIATYKSLNGPGAAMALPPPSRDETPVTTLKGLNGPPVASPQIATGVLTPLVEQEYLAPKIEDNPTKLAPPFTGTDPALEKIMLEMQEDDQAFAETEDSMRRSGWSSEHDIMELRKRRQEQQNLWQRRLDDALDQVKAESSLE